MPSERQLIELRFACPSCDEELSGTGTERRTCPHCGRSWQLTGGKWPFGGESGVVAIDPTDSFKSRLKLHPRFYTGLINLISPVYPHWVSEKRRLRKKLVAGVVAIDVGSGNSRVADDVVNVDVMPYPNVDVVTAAERLPFAAESVDIVISIAVLEHVQDSDAAIAEFVRVLRPGGEAYIFVPFIQGFHAAPYDYRRYTRPGLEQALRGLRVVRTENLGPTGGLIWVLGEWLSILFSFGIARLQRVLAMAFTTLLFPLKFLDSFLRHFPGAENISTGFLLVAVKDPQPAAGG